ncbi:phosphoribosylformylglycinamidine synthase subunit PurS [Leptospira wolffii]|uniref:Phosphoribosylformylglycinamidine synthase subunit PurS n=1 Tax=Leptospira wolffii TaxID=409998 RepID=A0A2M9Z7C9_9LEPT|nr:phosphoribosylformylglycinamidine synthase subunit PurS [Leptospira wolffii]EPG66435.1 phosphoribosylformylglycinamidine synthase, purS protein [Leptospira wolffii serovar Khorat str. Khorat-H2]PJZ64339.1 phosphoribosylformylglycinamidine synthase subunit PurS [Leptospira wolffii]TGK58301.1 phosphoribosylformylglycinamidine synthase subunit PurS [Leptospira wolffii]TGK66322.1 phosphoribosylformylglycinamidine synthase subunit PurS [Leptospira wolffii]TGK68979.1 phosphoribosylformylglycinami
MFIARINVTLKESVLDPQGSTVKSTLQELGEKSVQDVRVGKYIEVKLDTPDIATAEQTVKSLCEKLLVNHVIETYRSEIIPA